MRSEFNKLHEATLRRRGPIKDGQPVDSMIWSMHAADYPNSVPAQVKLRAFDATDKLILNDIDLNT